ncbi:MULTISPECIES: DMT family transporter [Pseudomonas]|uniref:DMT family transporter n=1 Tax=Pseudomonas TaxID=286 RepID=UPI0006D3EFC7|nr:MULTISPECIES: DMT family transporter [Pseudomonas]ANC04962.1 membrane protein [Pseudomonas putida]RSC29109.1 DMT family transporter [Pseudomonas putida]HEK0906319.1 DMT family transporter [Pseudomonas putida]HEK1768082.1 DMT family transporter [Pseudomonas putida]
MPKVIALSATLPLLIALLAGAAVPFQAGSNAALGRLLGHPLWAAGVSLLVSLMMLVPALLLMRAPMPQLQNLAQAPWWAWLGGVAGVIYITAALVLTPRLGAAGFIVCVIAGQVLSSLLIDQFGLMGLPEKPVNLPRLLGVAMIVGGMLVVQWGTARSA